MALNRKMVLPLFSTMKVCGQRAALGWGRQPLGHCGDGFWGQLLAQNLKILAEGWGEMKRETEGLEGSQHIPQVSGPSLGHPWLGGMRSSLGGCRLDLVYLQNYNSNKKGPLVILAELPS